MGHYKDGDVGVGVLPEGEKVLVGSVGLSSIAGERVGTGEAKMERVMKLKTKSSFPSYWNGPPLCHTCRAVLVWSAQKPCWAGHLRLLRVTFFLLRNASACGYCSLAGGIFALALLVNPGILPGVPVDDQ
jgi:hypothetical protein